MTKHTQSLKNDEEKSRAKSLKSRIERAMREIEVSDPKMKEPVKKGDSNAQTILYYGVRITRTKAQIHCVGRSILKKITEINQTQYANRSATAN